MTTKLFQLPAEVFDRMVVMTKWIDDVPSNISSSESFDRVCQCAHECQRDAFDEHNEIDYETHTFNGFCFDDNGKYVALIGNNETYDTEEVEVVRDDR